MPLLSTLTEFASAVETELGDTVLVGAKHISSEQNWPKVVCVPIDESLGDVEELGFEIDDFGSGNTAEQLIGYIRIGTDWHVWAESFAALETLRKSLYVAIARVARQKHSYTSLETGQYLASQQRTITHGGDYLVARVNVGFRLLDNSQTPLLTPTAAHHVGKLNDEVGC